MAIRTTIAAPLMAKTEFARSRHRKAQRPIKVMPSISGRAAPVLYHHWIYGAKKTRIVPAKVATALARDIERKKRSPPTITTYHLRFQYKAKACSISRIKKLQNCGRKIVVQWRIGRLTNKAVAWSPTFGFTVGNDGSLAAWDKIQGVCTIHS